MTTNLTGQFLVAGKTLHDPNFHRTVVLIIEHNDQGAMGLVVNRRTNVGMREALEEHFDVTSIDDCVHYGGPVEPSALFVVHSGLPEIDGESVVPGVYVGNNAEVFGHVIRDACDPDSDLRFRVIAGCSGWGPGQLENELDRGDWFVVPATAELTFHEDPDIVWDSAREAAARRLRILPDAPPSDPEWN